MDISIKDGEKDKESYLCFSYLPLKKLVEHVRATLRGKLEGKGHEFLYKLEDLARELKCTEIKTLSDEEFWKDTDWIRYPDGSYRKNLAPHLN